ncbi:MAG: substrate-binding domain-containing protein [Lentimicrobiaceae bacterium]|jgi:phosphate transport system substrate-binding protein
MKRNVLHPFFLALAMISMFAISCHNPMGVQKLDETPTRGKIRMSIDESFQLLYDTQIYTFESLYVNAHITPIYKPEVEVLADFMNDSVQTIVLTRDLTKAEKDHLLAQKYVARTTKVAHDALALIVNRENPDSFLLDTQFADILRGKLSNWKQINPKSPDKLINVVFDNNKSGNVRYFREKFALTGNFPSNCFAVNNNEEVINYVKNNQSALGIISVNWISDTQDSVSEKFLKDVRVLEVGSEIYQYCKPYQGYIAEGSYPFCRDVYMISRETFSGLGTGFVSFVAGDQGQRIVLKSGLVPATMPIRLIQIKKD